MPVKKRRLRVVNRSKGTVVAEQAWLAQGFWSRFVGLWGRRGLAPGQGLLLTPCSSIHTLFMRFTIDAVFLDNRDAVVKVSPWLRPFRLALGSRRARKVLELPAGTIARSGTGVGDRLDIELPEPR